MKLNNIYYKEIDESIGTRFIIKLSKNQNFNNRQFKNTDFKKLLHTKGFTFANEGLEFFIEIKVNKPVILTTKNRLEKYEIEVENTRKYMQQLAIWIDEVINVEIENNNCAVCGFDEFNRVYISGQYASLFAEREDGKYLKLEYCLKCKTVRALKLDS